MQAFKESIEVNAPIEYCYQSWHHFELFPSFMHNVKSVQHSKDDIWHWTLVGPYGDESAWDLHLANDDPNRLISWRTVEGPELDMWVDINFIKTRMDQTYITITINTMVPKGPIGAVMENLFAVTDKTISKNLEDFKRVAEEAWVMTVTSSSKGYSANERGSLNPESADGRRAFEK